MTDSVTGKRTNSNSRPTDVKDYLMLQNAQQLLGIVKGTFPDLAFNEKARSVECDHLYSEAQLLSCLWSDITSAARIGSSAEQDIAALLQEVCHLLIAGTFANEPSFAKGPSK